MATNLKTTDNALLATTRVAIPRNSRAVLVGWMMGLYMVLTWATAAVGVVLAATGSSAIGQEASIHAVILALVSILTLVFTINLLHGKPRADLRLCIIAIILATALIVTTIVLPLPIWMIIGHIVGTALLIGTLIALWPLPNNSRN